MLPLLLCFVAPEPKVVAYYPEWAVYARKFDVPAIPAAKLTHLVYAFARIEGGEARLFDSYAATDKAYPGDKWDAGAPRGSFNQLRKLKARHKHLKTLIALGGWTLSSPFSDAALTPASREKLAKSAVAFMEKHGFDGIDLDWEYPVGGGLPGNKTRPEDRANYVLLCAAIRKEMDARKKGYLLTAAGPGGTEKIKNFDLKGMAASVDWFNVMAYDFAGGWSARTGLNAPLRSKEGPSVESAVRAYLEAGVPAGKIVLGVPFYGRGWRGAKEGDGLGVKPAAGLPKGTWEPGVFDWKDLAANHVPKMKRHWHAEGEVPWLHDARTGLMISYDDPESIKKKGEFARKEKLGGAMLWEITADDAKSSLLDALRAGLKP
ncbi:MAG: glycoside hydrolase family 18 protein [Gemmataceae bacterium]|nr:glycoside hydrolase family 18 protein [Gemmataceae bacterium]